ncbi:nitrogen regulatory protein P-II family [Gillisia sp. Hel1_33_143]|uniref:P-II family nitrogen regulator n=1 Tax=unclassified Gillisia TaxID=2615025 RepID=UPI0003AB224B|nr:MULTISPECIES: P-II family nitrogen regulator [unclassified Gillisia]SDR69961.1 nitrogen regulatory protein P-II family [Gillisia sp. Hel1_33_143]HEA31429.1 P-II family nitrogen regulator [Leeuwenhoekiella sp.]|tara:strand:+ start:69202 stop:69540 length:339 start_codon:yes stop_codon:yes gene_type:complete
MKEVKAFVKPNRIQRVIEALSENGFKSMTLSQSEGTGAFKAKGARPSLDFHVTDSPVVKIELVCQNEEAQAAIEIIMANGKTEEPGDGIIYLSNIEDAFQIKTGDSLKRYDL